MKNIIGITIIIIMGSLLCGYMMYGVFCDYHLEDSELDFLEENWTDTTKRPYNLHGLDGEKE